MTQVNLFEETRLKAVLSSILSVPLEKITADFNKDSLASWDSLRHMNLILALEEEFGITIPDEDVPNLTSYPLIKLVIQEILERG